MSQRNDPQVLGVLYPPGAGKIISMMLWIWGLTVPHFGAFCDSCLGNPHQVLLRVCYPLVN